MDDATRPGWVSQRAVAWVLDDAPCPSDLLPVLTAIARRCDEHGRGSRQSAPTIAGKAGKSVRQVHRDIARLRDLKLLELGDQSLVAHLPAHNRPVVYDVSLHVKGPKPVKGSRNPKGQKKEAMTWVSPPDMDDRGDTDVTPPPDMDDRSPRDMGVTPPPDTHVTQTNLENNPLDKPNEEPSSSCAADPAGSRPATPKEEEGEEISNDQQTDNHTTTAAGIANHYRPNITAIEARRLTHPITQALNNGWTVDLIRTELDADHTGLANLAAGLITRARTMAGSQPPPPPPAKVSYSGHTAAVANQPPCPHGIAGGDIAIPNTLWSPCATCRRQAGWTPDGDVWTPQSPADRAVAQAAALAARYAAEDGTGNPFQPTNHRSSSYRPWRDPHPSEYERPL